jgi:hypothetical protein
MAAVEHAHLPALRIHTEEPNMMQQLPNILTTHAIMKAPRRPSLSATTPPLTAPNIAPIFSIEANQPKLAFTSPAWNSEDRHFSGRAERGPVRPTEKPNERAPQATSSVKRKVRVRASDVIGSSADSLPSTDGRGVVFGDMDTSSDCAIPPGQIRPLR